MLLRRGMCLLFATFVCLPEQILIAQQNSAAAPLPAVTVSQVERRDITPSFSYVGRIEAVAVVDLRARVEGYLEARHFQEGREVSKDEVLFELERAPYEAVVAQREADLAGAKASLSNATVTVKRYRPLRKKGTISQADLDKAIADENTTKAAVLQAQAALQKAQLELAYTRIASPIDGRISRSRYSVGNLVGPGSEPLATVTDLDPIYVTIAVSEKDLLEARRQGIDLENPRVEPFLILSDGSEYPHRGRFDYLDTEVSQTTDTILARAVFSNSEGLLLPGQFVSVSVRQKQALSALVIAQASVQEDQQGYFVLVVDQTDKVEVRRVEVGSQVDSDWIIEKGLAEGERVIVQGIQKVRPDMLVKPVLDEA